MPAVCMIMSSLLLASCPNENKDPIKVAIGSISNESCGRRNMANKNACKTPKLASRLPNWLINSYSAVIDNSINSTKKVPFKIDPMRYFNKIFNWSLQLY